MFDGGRSGVGGGVCEKAAALEVAARAGNADSKIFVFDSRTLSRPQASPGLDSHGGVTARERASSALPKKTGRSKPRLDAKYRAPLRARVLPLVTTRGTSTRRRLARAASTPQSLSLSRPGRSPRPSSADRPLRFKTRVHLSRARDERLLRAARARRPVRRERGQAEAPDRRQDLQGAHGPFGERARGAPFRPPARRNEGSHPSREPRTANRDDDRSVCHASNGKSFFLFFLFFSDASSHRRARARTTCPRHVLL